MIFKQYRYEPLGQASYIVGCIRSKKAFVVDPIEDLGVDHYVLEAADLGLSIVGVLETHVHADFVSCARELSGKLGVPHYLHEAAEGLVKYDFTPVTDGQVLELGKVRVEVLWTPGHTPEHSCFVLIDGARSEEPWAVLTGDCLFVGDVGRPDLLLEDEKLDVLDEAQRAESQYRSIHDKLFALPDHVEVWPGHYGGSTCGGVNMSGKASSTIYFEKHFNLALEQPDAAAFAAFVKESSRPFPEDYARIKALNLGLIEKADADDVSVPGLGAEEVEHAVGRGAVILDLRPPFVFAREHIPGAVNLQFNRADLADRAEMVLPAGLEVVLCAGSDPVAYSAATILGEAGYGVAGILEDGAAGWKAAGRTVTEMPVITVDQLRHAPGGYSVVDAREGFEYRFGHIPGALHLSSMEAWDRVEEIPAEGSYAIVCGDQVRSALVGSILLRSGRRATLVGGGMTDWLDRGFPLDKEEKKART